LRKKVQSHIPGIFEDAHVKSVNQMGLVSLILWSELFVSFGIEMTLQPQQQSISKNMDGGDCRVISRNLKLGGEYRQIFGVV